MHHRSDPPLLMPLPGKLSSLTLLYHKHTDPWIDESISWPFWHIPFDHSYLSNKPYKDKPLRNLTTIKNCAIWVPLLLFCWTWIAGMPLKKVYPFLCLERDIERKNKRTCLKKVCNTLGFHQCKKNKEAKKICIYERKILVKAIARIAKVAVQTRQVWI